MAERAKQDALQLAREQQAQMQNRQVLNLIQIEDVTDRVVRELENDCKEEVFVEQVGRANGTGDGDEDGPFNSLQIKFARANDEVSNARKAAAEVRGFLNCRFQLGTSS